MRRKDREILDNAIIDSYIKEAFCCRLGFYDQGEVYIVPLNFGFVHEEERIFYFHSALNGRKVDLASQNPKVGFELESGISLITSTEKASDYGTRYKSVIGTGNLSLVDDFSEKKIALKAIMAQYSTQEWEITEEDANSVKILKLVVEKLSCKEHE